MIQGIHSEVIRRFGRDPKIIFTRDEWRCLLCGSSNDLTIDHIDGKGRHSKHPNNDINNLRTLCRKCHGSVDGKRGGGRKYPYPHKVDVMCSVCQKSFKRYLYEIKRRKRLYCSRICFLKGGVK